MCQASKEKTTYPEQERLRLIADEMNAAVFEWTREDGRFYSSSSYEKYALSQVSADELLANRGPKELVHPEDLPLLKKFFDETKSLKNRVETTLRLQMITGEYRWCKMVGVFYRDENRKLERIVGIIIDVNEEHERSFMLDSIINAMPCGVGIFTFARTLLCSYYSDGFAKMAGISREEMDKKIAGNTVLSSLIAPADFPKIAQMLIELSSKGLPMNLTYRYIYVDGSMRWLHLSATKLREENGYPVYYCVFTNPTEEVAQYGNMVENSPTGVYVAEKATRKTMYVNEAAALMFGFERGHKLKDRTVEAALAETGRKPLLMREQIDSLTADEYTEFSIKQNEKYYSVQAKEIMWNGVVSYILYFNDKTNEQNLLSSIPGGVAIYRVKKDGRIATEYVSDGLAAMCGYTTDEFLDLLRDDAVVNVAPEDIPNIMEKINSAINGNGVVTVMYRIYTKENKELMIRLDANMMPTKQLGSDDIAAFYAVHTIVSEELKEILNRQKYVNELMKAQEHSHYIRKTLEIALESAGILAWRYDYKTKCITDSGTLGEAYNLPRVVENVPEQIIKMGFVAKESQDDFIRMFDNITKEEVVSSDINAVAIDGKSSAWFHQIYTPVFDEQGNYVDAVGIAIDITEQKNQELQYEEQQRLNKMAAADALSTASLNLTQNRIISFSSSIPELMSKEQFNTATELLGSIHDDDQADWAERRKFDIVSSPKQMIQAFESGQTHIEVVFHYFHNTRWVKATYDMLKNPYTGDIEAITSLYDVTDSVRAQKVISQLTELDYQSLLLIDTTTEKAVPYQFGHNDANIESLMSLQKYDDSGRTGFEGFMKKYAVPGTAERAIKENSLPYVKERLAKAPYYECMHSLVRDGKVDHYRVLYTYLKDDSNFILSAVQRVTEIYDRELQQKAELSAALASAESANKAKTAFLSRVSHDMRTPLNGILGLTTLMKDVSTDSRISRDLTELEMSGKYLLELINDTLDVSRIENGKLELHPAVCDSRVCFNNVLNLVHPGIKEKNINFEIKENNLPFTYLYVDEGRLQQIAMNILGNAIKFTPEGGRIRCIAKTISMENGIVTDCFIVEDSGCGMEEEFLPHLFEAFSQENASNTNSKQGTGLGMSITKSLVELMNGEINVSSEKGVGTKVEIILRLPIATNEQVEKWKNMLDSHAKDYNLHGKRVLLCEDHPLNTKIAIRLLEKKDMIVDHAENGKIGVAMFEASEPGYYDAILMDIRMPEMDGIDATKAIRKLHHPDAISIPIIAMTANALDEDVRRTRKAGMDAHLSKPIVPEKLYGTLEQFINPKEQYIRKRVLIVDDVEMNRAFMRVALKPTYEIFEAENGQQALEILKKHNGMDAVVTDIQMPVMDGYELIRKIRENDNYRHMVIIANTQYDNRGQEKKLLELGANDFIYKAANSDVIKIRVRNALHSVI